MQIRGTHKNRPHILIIDYGMGNLFSLQRAINYLGNEAIISSEPATINSAAKAILPGVGAFADGMSNLQKLGLVEPLKDYVHSGKPLLGICLGMQLFMTESEEFGLHPGLDFIKGRVWRFPESTSNKFVYKIPHVGWNSLHLPFSLQSQGKRLNWQNTILENIDDGDFVYFVHSYTVIPDSTEVILTETEYAGNQFCSALQQRNIIGCQFHPEVSGKVGLQIIKNFCSLSN